MMEFFIGIDNGVTGSIAVIGDGNVDYFDMPTRSEQSYTKTKQKITRVDVPKLREILHKLGTQAIKCMLERPMVNPMRFKASASALRALEATLIVLEESLIPYSYCDSKEWVKMLLPHGIKGTPEIKQAAKDIARRLFPTIELKKNQDADSLLIAEYCKRGYKIQ